MDYLFYHRDGVIVTAWQGGLIEEMHEIVIMFAAWRSIAAFVA